MDSKEVTKTNLEEFLNDAKNMHAREEMLMHRLLLDIKTGAARRGYYLNSYFDNVDHDGFDVIFDDQDYIKKIQVKTVQKKGKTSAWNIHKRLLRPSWGMVEKLGFEPSAFGEGSEGGVVLIEFWDDGQELKADYYYTDTFVLTLFYCGFIKRTDGRSQKSVKEFCSTLRDGSGRELTAVPKSAFLKAKSASELLSLMGLHSLSSGGWKHQLIVLASNVLRVEPMEMAGSPQVLLDFVWSEVSALCDSSGLQCGDVDIQ